jgi:hypothetical protein
VRGQADEALQAVLHEIITRTMINLQNDCFYEDSFVKPFLIAASMWGRHGPRTKACGVRGVGRLAPALRPDPRSGCDERSSQCSDELLSVPDMSIRHPMLNARKAGGQTPVTDAPLL